MIKLRMLRSDVYLLEPGIFGEYKVLLPEKHDVLQYCCYEDGGTWYDIPVVEGPDVFREDA